MAVYLGLAAIIGAFLAGMAFAEVRERYKLRQRMDSVNDFLVPFFFVNIGLQVSIGSFHPVLLLAIIITILAIVGKVVGWGIASWSLGTRSSVIIGIGMMPRGEVGIIIAMVGLSLNSIHNDLFSVVLFMSIITTLIAPPLLAWSIRRKGQSVKPSLKLEI